MNELGKLLYIYLDNDTNVFTLNYDVDDVKYNLVMSNKGWYTTHLNQAFNIKIHKKNLKYYLKDRMGLGLLIKPLINNIPSQEVCSIIRNEPYLFEDLNENNGANLYKTVKRIHNMTLLYLENNNETLFNDIVYSLDFIFNTWYSGKENYKGNWWNYEIGVPKLVNEILILLYDKLEIGKILDYLNKEKFYIPNAKYIFYRRNYPSVKKEEASYANLSDNIYTVLLRAIIEENDEEIKYLYLLINNTLKFTDKGDGFYLDGGFIQHQNIPYNASYGEVLLTGLSKILKIFKALKYDISGYLLIIKDLAYKAYEPFLYNKMALDCVRGRATGRKELDCYYSHDVIIKALEILNSLDDKASFSDLINREKGNDVYQNRTYAINSIDRFIKRTSNYLIAISANSSYIAGYESINDENLQGSYSSNSVFDVYYDGVNYKNYALNINPFYRNGSTNPFEVEEPNAVIENNITAGVVYGDYGVVGYHQNGVVKGYFTKYLLKDSIVCVGTNISSNKEYVTTVFHFDGDYEYHNKTYTIGNKRIIVDQCVSIDDYKESKSYYSLNHSELKNEYEISGKRMIIKNPIEYVYQVYPEYKSDDEFEFIKFNNSHVLKHNGLLFITIFTDEGFKYDGLTIEGKASLIVDTKNLAMYISTGCKEKTRITLDYQGYDYAAPGLKRIDDIMIIEDEFIHKINLRKKI